MKIIKVQINLDKRIRLCKVKPNHKAHANAGCFVLGVIRLTVERSSNLCRND